MKHKVRHIQIEINQAMWSHTYICSCGTREQGNKGTIQRERNKRHEGGVREVGRKNGSEG